ncbi:MAG: methyltransferase domain-containing protein [Alphaproteobacteria bacterium]|nr:methyltransferase domain-containing protein [Alphaproteobacteria bacterium]
MSRVAEFRRIYAELVCAIAGATDPRIAEAFATVPREHYLGLGPWSVSVFDHYVETPSDDPAYLYQNHLFAIDAERRLNNGDPVFLARMIKLLAIQPGDRAVHVGAGVGYYTAIMAELVGADGRVAGIEIDPELAARAAKNLSQYRQVEVTVASGSDLSAANVDALFINAGATHPLANWLDALAPGGRLVLPLTPDEGGGVVMRITRERGGYTARFASNVWIFECAGAREPRANRRLARAIKTRGMRDVQTLRRDRHRRGDTCWLHGPGWCFSTEPLAPSA